MMAYQLTHKQKEAMGFLTGPACNIMLRGGSRSGKTFLLVRALVVRALAAPGSRHAIFRLRRNHVRSTIWLDTLPKVLRLCFPTTPTHKNEADLIVTLPGGSQIILAGLDDKERVEKILGSEFSTLYFNEASQIPWSSIETAMTRHAQNSGLSLKTYYDCNPPSRRHWSYRMFALKQKPGTCEPLPNPDDYVELLMNPADNAANLPPKYFEILASMSEMQRLRFERGEWASEVDGALWSLEQIDSQRASWRDDTVFYNGAPVEMRRIVVAVDPSGTKGDGYGTDGRYYILEDCSCQASPEGWARRTVSAYHRHSADRIIGEANFGGAMVESLIRLADRHVQYRAVHASRGKVVRAEPISALYEKRQVSHVGCFDELEDQLANMTSTGFVGEGSPDRADALVWALTELAIKPRSTVRVVPL